MSRRREVEPVSHGRLAAYLALFYGLFHAALYAVGLRFDLAPLGMFAHYADPELLRTRLLESCFYLHVQPPLYNLLVGLVLKLCPGWEGIAFQTIFLLSGFALYVLLVLLQTRLGVSRAVAVVTGTLLVCSPSFLLFEHLLVYTLHCALLLVIAALLLHEFLTSKRGWAGWAFFGCLFLLCGIRSMYHLAYYVAVATAVMAWAEPPRRRVLWMALIPGLLLCSFYVKSYVLFGQFTTMSFMGKGLWIKTVGNLSWAQRERLAAEGRISDVSLVERFWAVDFYPEAIREAGGFEGIPVLRQKTKSTGEVNYNHVSQLVVSRRYMEDALYVLRQYPKTYLCSTAWAALTFLSPMPQELPGLKWWKAAYDRALYGKINVRLARFIPQLGASEHVPYLFLMVGYPLLFCYGAWQGWRGGRRNPLNRAQRGVVLFLCFTMLYVAALSVVLELAETNRYRFETEAFYMVFLGLVVERVVRQRARGPSAA